MVAKKGMAWMYEIIRINLISNLNDFDSKEINLPCRKEIKRAKGDTNNNGMNNLENSHL